MATTEENDPGVNDNTSVTIGSIAGDFVTGFVSAQHAVSETVTGSTSKSIWPVLLGVVAVITCGIDGAVPTSISIAATSLLLVWSMSR